MKQKFRCANNLFGYCAGVPKLIEAPRTFYYTDVTGIQVVYIGTTSSCLNDKNTCGLFRTLMETLPAELQESLK